MSECGVPEVRHQLVVRRAREVLVDGVDHLVLILVLVLVLVLTLPVPLAIAAVGALAPARPELLAVFVSERVSE